MTEYIINVNEVEELQTINNAAELNNMFAKAQSMVVQGGTVILVRQSLDGSVYKFDEITTETDLDNYKQTMFKYF